jgi:DNA-binding GntR family transcriptional regulator
MSKATTLAYDALREGILSGRYPPGFRLGETQLADEIGVSRTPVRDALRRLVSDGFVDYVPNRGATVRTWSIASISDLIEVRATLAALAAERAAQFIGQDDIDRLATINERIATLATTRSRDLVSEASRLNLQFHDIVFRSSRNEWLPTIMAQTAQLANVQRVYFGFGQSDWIRSVERYRDLITAFRNRDSIWAGSAFRAHFHASRHAIEVYARTQASGSP